MIMKVLITVASRHGSTKEIATLIAGLMEDAGLEADVRDPDDITSLAGYDAAVIGSGVYMGRWLDPARRLIKRCHGEFAGRRVWLFSCGPLGEPAKPDSEPGEVAGLRDATGAIDHRVFHGRLVRSELGFGEKVVVAGVRAPYGDYRRWDDIATWARQIANALRTVDLAATLDIPVAEPVGT
jgi:menaquinone-dependent protoporphyrinogen oxidase